MVEKGGYVYIVANHSHTTLYIGVTSDLYARILSHKSGEGSSFTKRHNCHKLLYYECFDHIVSAIEREKQLKKWKRDRKNRIIREFNPEHKDLFEEIVDFR